MSSLPSSPSNPPVTSQNQVDASSHLPSVSSIGVAAPSTPISGSVARRTPRHHANAHRYEPYQRPSTATSIAPATAQDAGTLNPSEELAALRAVLPGCGPRESVASVLRMAVERIRDLESAASNPSTELSRFGYYSSSRLPGMQPSQPYNGGAPVAVRQAPLSAAMAIAASLGTVQQQHQQYRSPLEHRLPSGREAPASSRPVDILTSGMVSLSSMRDRQLQQQVLRLMPRLRTVLDRRATGIPSPLRQSTASPSPNRSGAPSGSPTSSPHSPLQTSCSTIHRHHRSITASPAPQNSSSSSLSSAPSSPSSLGSPSTAVSVS